VVPCFAHQSAPHIDKVHGFYVAVESMRTAFNAMLGELKPPRDGETGLQLIRRSMDDACTVRLEEHWVQGEKMLDHQGRHQ
jgi:hypothetical protein